MSATRTNSVLNPVSSFARSSSSRSVPFSPADEEAARQTLVRGPPRPADRDSLDATRSIFDRSATGTRGPSGPHWLNGACFGHAASNAPSKPRRFGACSCGFTHTHTDITRMVGGKSKNQIGAGLLRACTGLFSLELELELGFYMSRGVLRGFLLRIEVPLCQRIFQWAIASNCKLIALPPCCVLSFRWPQNKLTGA